MNEYYKPPETKDSVKNLGLTESEIKTINDLGLTSEDLSKLLSGHPFAEGSSALIFELPNSEQRVIAKVWKNPKQDVDRAKHENVALRLLRVRGFEETPRLMGYLKSTNIIFEEEIEGSPIDIFDKITIAQLAETIAKIHSIELHAYGKPLTQRKKGTQKDCLNDGIDKLRESLSSLPNFPEITPLIEQAIDQAKNEAEEKADTFQNNNFTLIHFDLNRNNILRSKNSGKIIFIDWAQASAGDSAMDIAKLFLKLNFNDEQREEFLVEYEKRLPKKDKYFKDRLSVYETLVLVNSILWRLRVLNNIPNQEHSTTEEQFYIRVRNGLNEELDSLRTFLSNTYEK
ncbi:MAG: aminoglycoside phosphotransferase family protein [Patescibacteria group bacterium]